ncbi:unnamed protein product [Dovyalis caffra]|uniref:Stomagen C-terminal domain-containing protein n=1 Tax=Dovyalis caffra TaxID=77055 RepID=A0AAV1SGM3_9ROSI|nr:unnamed protein product [Dovyalis caffra]
MGEKERDSFRDLTLRCRRQGLVFFDAGYSREGKLATVFQIFITYHGRVTENQELLPYRRRSSTPLREGQMSGNSKRLMIGSTAPTCTYNECRGCKYKCRAEQVPVEGNDPINSAYHYKWTPNLENIGANAQE